MDIPHGIRLLSLLAALAGACATPKRSSPTPIVQSAAAVTASAASSASPKMNAPAPAASATSVAGPDGVPADCGMPASLAARGFRSELSPTSNSEPVPFVAGTTTLVVLPDTQYYADCGSRYFADQTKWTRRELDARNVKGVLTLGDLTDKNSAREWQYLKSGLGFVENEVPVVLVSGNHDVGDRGTANRRTSSLAQYFPEPPGRAKQALVETARPGDIENAYYRIALPRVTLGVLALEWSPRTAIIAWANRVLARNPRDRVIILTHAYLYEDGTRYDWWKKGAEQEWNPLAYGTGKQNAEKATTAENLHPEGAHDGEMLWNELVKKHPGVFLVMNGHVLGRGVATLLSRAQHGNGVAQVLVNYQMLKDGGLGYLRLVELLPDGRTLRQKTYSPSLGLFATGSDQNGDLPIDPPLW